MQIVTSPPKKTMFKFLFFAFFFLLAGAAAELWLAFQWLRRFKQWPELRIHHCIAHPARITIPSLWLLSENMHNKRLNQTTFESNPA